MEGCQLQELLDTNFCRFENPTGLGFSSSVANLEDCVFIDSLSSSGGFLGCDQQTYSSNSSASSSQVSMDDEWSNGFLNQQAMSLQESILFSNSTRRFSDHHQPWYGTNQSTEAFDPSLSSYPYCYGQFEGAELGSLPTVSQFDHNNNQLGSSPNVTDQQPFLPTSSTRPQQTMLKSSNAAGVKRKNQTTKRSEPNIKKRARKEPDSSPGNSSKIKVSKEKMGNRITTLQRLVSPFGKADTASVLSECIEYIRFLHEQVSVLSSSHMSRTISSDMEHFQDLDECFYEECVPGSGSDTDLRSRGLCIVPIPTKFPLRHETPVDFWTPTLIGECDHSLPN